MSTAEISPSWDTAPDTTGVRQETIRAANRTLMNVRDTYQLGTPEWNALTNARREILHTLKEQP